METRTKTVLCKTLKEEFNDEEHGDFLRGRLWSIQREADFCDVTFIVEENEFFVHKVIMAASPE